MESQKIKCLDFEGSEHLFDVEDYSFRPSVYGILVNKDQEILMSKHNGRYCLPGGGIDLVEKVYVALEREIFEETGLRLASAHIVACDDSFFLVPYENKPVHSILLFYWCVFTGETISVNNVDMYEREYAEKPEWIPIKNVLEMDNLVFPIVKKILKDESNKR